MRSAVLARVLSAVLARVLDEEFLRVAKQERITLDELVAEVAAEIGVTPRQIYNYRSGKTELPAVFIPALCRRFRSRSLLCTLDDEAADVDVEVPESFDLNRMLSSAAREHLSVHERYLSAFEGGVDPVELDELRKSNARIARLMREFYAIAEADCRRRLAVRGRV